MGAVLVGLLDPFAKFSRVHCCRRTHRNEILHGSPLHETWMYALQ